MCHWLTDLVRKKIVSIVIYIYIHKAPITKLINIECLLFTPPTTSFSSSSRYSLRLTKYHRPLWFQIPALQSAKNTSIPFLRVHRFTQVPSKDLISEISNLIKLLTFQSPLRGLIKINKKHKVYPIFQEAKNRTKILK